jgi:hypothetical protein
MEHRRHRDFKFLKIGLFLVCSVVSVVKILCHANSRNTCAISAGQHIQHSGVMALALQHCRPGRRHKPVLLAFGPTAQLPQHRLHGGYHALAGALRTSTLLYTQRHTLLEFR